MNHQAPVRRCAPCDEDWPNQAVYNLCPRCQRNTYASTASDAPDRKEAAAKADRYQAIREFDAACDLKAEMDRLEWAAGMEALLAQTRSIADPPRHDDLDPGLPSLSELTDPRNAQDVRFHDLNEDFDNA